jgi:hypothetical protein
VLCLKTTARREDETAVCHDMIVETSSRNIRCHQVELASVVAVFDRNSANSTGKLWLLAYRAVDCGIGFHSQ